MIVEFITLGGVVAIVGMLGFALFRIGNLKESYHARPSFASRIEKIENDVDELRDMFRNYVDTRTPPFRVLGRFEVAPVPINQGGMGTIHRATDGQKEIAVKLIREEFASDDKYRKRFQREAGLLAAVDHDNVVRIYDYGINGEVWIAMEFLNGVALDLAPLPMSVEDTIEVAKSMCGALERVHALGIVHCDIKTANIMRVPDGEDSYRDVLIDFGLGFREGVSSTDVLARTEVRGVHGTPSYAAPEQSQGEPTSKSDIYSLGVSLFEIVTGRLPFRETDPGVVAIHHATKPRPNANTIRKDLDGWLNDLIRQMMAINPDDRPTATEVLKNLERDEVSRG